MGVHGARGSQALETVPWTTGKDRGENTQEAGLAHSGRAPSPPPKEDCKHEQSERVMKTHVDCKALSCPGTLASHKTGLVMGVLTQSSLGTDWGFLRPGFSLLASAENPIPPCSPSP